MKRLIAALGASVGIALATPASAIFVGGINFGSPGTSELETTTFAETFVDAVGQHLSGYGLVNTVNGNSAYCLSPPCALYFYFHDYTVQLFNPVTGVVDFTGGVVDLYYSSSAPINFFAQGSPANIAFITGQTPWVELIGHTFTDPVFNGIHGIPGATYTLNGNGTLTGGTLSENGEGLVDVNGGFGLLSVQAFLDGNSQLDGLGGNADKTITSSSNNSVLNPFDTCTPIPGQFCLQGTLNARGATVIPEPATLALLGLGLSGLAFVRRRKRS